MHTGNGVTTSSSLGAESALAHNPFNIWLYSGNLQILTCKTWKSLESSLCSDCSRQAETSQSKRQHMDGTVLHVGSRCVLCLAWTVL